MLYGLLSSLGSYTPQMLEVSWWQAVEQLLVLCGGVGDHGCRCLPMLPVSSGTRCFSVALPWNSLCCSGGMWCHVRRTEQGWGGINFFFPDNLFLPGDTLCSLGGPKALGLWMTLCLHCHVKLGFEHTEAQTPLLSTPFRCWLWLCTGSSKEKEENWGGTGSVWLRLTPLYGQ